MEHKRIRVTFIVNDFLVGGMQRQLVEQLRFYDREAFELSLITLLSFPKSETLFAELPADMPVYQLSFRSLLDLRSWKELRALLKKVQPDLVVSSLYFANTISRALQPQLGYASIAREHNTYIDKPVRQQFIDRFLAKRSYKIVAVSKRVATFTAAQERIPLAHFEVIQNGIDTQKSRDYAVTLPPKAQLQEDMGIEPGKTVFLNVGRLIPQKGQQLLIAGFAVFHRTHPDAVLLIAGDGPLYAQLAAQAAEAGVAGAVKFLGYQKDMGRVYRAADVFVSTSRIEGFSNAHLEALAYGLPLVSTPTAGTDELLEEAVNGFYITDETPDGVSAVLEKFTSGGVSRYTAAAYATAEKFDIRTTVAKYQALFRESTATI